MKKQPEFLILSGDGINCENETALAFENAGASPTIVHINDLLENPKMLEIFDGMAIPGGFSFGDEMGSGQVLALKIKYGLLKEFSQFVDAKKPIIGICNGFQTLVKLGLLPRTREGRIAALTENKDGTFLDRWASLKVDQSSVCAWTKDLPNEIELPIRHGEGRLVFNPGDESKIYSMLKENGQIPFTYTEDVNGSYREIAAICDPTGLILGMMPHPEAYLYQATYRKRQGDVLDPGLGQLLFNNIVNHLMS